MNFDKLSVDEIAALEGVEREAWYAHVRGDDKKAAAILASYPKVKAAPRPEPGTVETAVSEPEVEQAVKPRGRTRKG